MPQQSQHIDEPVVTAAKPRAQDLAVETPLAAGLDDLRQRHGLVRGNGDALLGLVEAAVLGGVGGERRRGAEQAEQNERERESRETGMRRGFRRAPVNAG